MRDFLLVAKGINLSYFYPMNQVNPAICQHKHFIYDNFPLILWSRRWVYVFFVILAHLN